MTRKTEHLVHPNERMKIPMSRQRARPGLETEARRGGKRGGGSGGRTTRGTGKTTDGDADGTDERDERKAREKRRQTASARASSGDGDEKEFKGTRGELVDSTATPRWDDSNRLTRDDERMLIGKRTRSTQSGGRGAGVRRATPVARSIPARFPVPARERVIFSPSRCGVVSRPHLRDRPRVARERAERQ
jgi:hypothetical protein